MKLPDIEYAPVQRVSDQVPKLDAERRRSFQVIEEGLAAFGRELVKTETQRATVDLHEGLANVELELNASPYVSAKYVREKLGDDLSKLPAELRAQLTRKHPTTGEETDREDLPTWAFAGAIYEKAARDLTEKASQGISGTGWQTAFKDAAAGDVVQRKARFAAQQAHALHTYLNAEQKSAVERMANTGNFGGALRLLEASHAIDPTERVHVRTALEARQQADPVLQAVQLGDVEAMKKAKAELASPDAFPALTQHQRYELQKHVETALKGKALDEEGRAKVDELLAASGGDTAKAIVAARGITRTDLFDEVDKRLKGRLAEEHALRVANDTPREGRLEVGIYRFGILDRTSADYTGMSDEGRARVESKLLAVQRTRKAEDSQERRQQREIDRYLEAFYDGSLALSGEQGKDQLSIDIDHSDLFADGSPTLREKLKAKQVKRQAEWQKGQGVSRQMFLDQVNDTARSLGYAKPKAEAFRAAVVNEYDAYLTAHPDQKVLPPAETARILGDAILVGDSATSTLGHAFSGNQAAFQARMKGDEFHAFPAGEQPAPVRAVLEKLRGTQAPPAPAPGAKRITNGKQSGWLLPGKPLPAGWREE